MNESGIVWNGFSGHAGENNELYVTLLYNRELGWSYQLIYETPGNNHLLSSDGLLKNSIGASLETAQKLTDKAVLLYKKEKGGE